LRPFKTVPSGQEESEGGEEEGEAAVGEKREESARGDNSKLWKVYTRVSDAAGGVVGEGGAK